MHIGFLASDLSHRHGWAHYSLSLIRALQRAGVQMTVIAAENCPEVEGVELHRLLPASYPAEKNLLLNSLLTAPTVGRLLGDCDIIHALIEPYAPLGAWVADNRPFYVTAYGSYVVILPRRRWPAGAFYRWSFRRARALACISSYTAKIARQTLPDVRAVYVPDSIGVDADYFANLPHDGVERRGPTVLAVGAVKLRKGTLELVRAMYAVRQSMPDVQCVILGSLDAEPSYSQQVRAEINTLRLDDCVHLLGHVPEATKLAWYGAADVFALPSLHVGRKFEGFGLVYLEAGAAGLPAIGTYDCGAEDAIEHGVTGLLVPQSDVTLALADAIISLLNDPARAAQMGAAGRARAQHQTWDRAAQQVIALYEGRLQR
jgi:glycosyltransferase involved in cell wall biosynthesis